MILIGQYDSSFVRRVGIALRLYGLPFEHRPWSVFSDAEKVQALNPLMRVPTMVLDDGFVLVDSNTMLDHIDGLVAEEHRLWPNGGERRQAQRVAALATGLADKAVSLFYELRLHDSPSPLWEERCIAQIRATLEALERERAERSGNHLFGGRITHADIALTCALRHASESHPQLIDLTGFPALAAHCRHFEAQPPFQEISQPFIPPAS